MTSKYIGKLSLRLEALYKLAMMVHKDHIYDLCCDHGKLSYKLWQKSKAYIFAVDCALPVIKSLEKKVAPLVDERFSIIYKKAENLVFKDNALVIIAGVGAYTTIDIIKSITSQNLVNTQLLICCHQNTEVLREFLINHSHFKIQHESLIKEKKQFYELMLLGESGQKVTLIGEQLWHGENKGILQEYYKKQLHYWRVNQTEKAKLILEEYKRIGKLWGL